MKTLLFDYGGTLDTAARHWNYVLLDAYHAVAISEEPELLKVAGAAWREAYVHGERSLARQPIILPEDDFYTLLLKKVRIELTHLRAHAGVLLTDERAEHCAQEVARVADAAARRHVKESQHVLQTLSDRGYRFVLVTNFYGNISAVLRGYGLTEFFQTIIESAVVGVRKPDTAIWQLGVEAAGVPASDCVAIGDSYSKDIVPAAQIGCSTVWFKGEEWEAKAYDETLPTHIITRLDQLLNLLP